MVKSARWVSLLRRVTSMGRHELLDRLRQQLTARADLLRHLSGYDFASGMQGETAGPQGRFFFTPAEAAARCALLKQVFPAQADDIVFRAEKICHHHFDLLGYENPNSFGRAFRTWEGIPPSDWREAHRPSPANALQN